MRDDYFTNAEADAGRFAAHFGEVDDDRPSPSDLVDCECPPPNYEYDPHPDCPKHGRP